MHDLAIQTNGLTCQFGELRAVDNLDLKVPTGTIFGFLGPNGAGKTTTIRLLLGLIQPTDGDVEVLGYDTKTHADEVRANSGALLEHSGVYEQLSAEENLEFYGRVWHIPDEERRHRIKELLSRFELWERRSDRSETWSKGMRQKLALVRTLLHKPKLIFLDEPTEGLDVMSANLIRKHIAELVNHEDVTIFLTTHNMQEAEELCHEIAVIRDGKLVTVGSPDQLKSTDDKLQINMTGEGFNDGVIDKLKQTSGVLDVRKTEAGISVEAKQDLDVSAVVSMLVGEGVSIEEIKRDKTSLTEAFINLMKEEKP